MGLHWTNPDWIKQAHSWIEDALTEQNSVLTGPIQQPHIRPWATVLRAPTNVGDVFLKAVVPAFSHEIQVTQALYHWCPDYLPHVLKSDVTQGWMLIADGGQRLREAFTTKPTLEQWSDVLTAYAYVQQTLVDHVDELLAFGLPNQRLDHFPHLYETLLADTQWLCVDQSEGITSMEYQRLIKAIPYVHDICQRLSSHAIPNSIHHNDLHDGNIFAANGRYLFFDWGDSCISHPFFSLRTAFISIENTFNLEEDDPVIKKQARIYLKSWADFETVEHIERAFGMAQRLWSLSTAFKYHSLLNDLPSARDENTGAIPALLQEFLDANQEL